MQQEWGDFSEASSNDSSALDGHTTHRFSNLVRSRHSQSHDENVNMESVHSQGRGKTRHGGVADVVIYPPTSRTRNERFASHGNNDGNFPETRRSPKHKNSSSPQNTNLQKNSTSSWFPMTLPSIGSLVSTPSDEQLHYKNRISPPKAVSSPTFLEKIGTGHKSSTDRSKPQQPPINKKSFHFESESLKPSSVQENGRQKARIPFKSPSVWESPPKGKLRKNGPNSIRSVSLSSSKQETTCRMKTASSTFPKSRSRSRSYSRSPSPVYERPSRKIKTDNSEFHNLLSCAASPDDNLFLEALELLTTSPNPRQLAKTKLSDAHDWTALHIASLSNPPLYLIYALLLVFPEGAAELDSAGRLPLHLAAGSETNVCVLNTLVRFYTDGIYTKDDRGLIPLHLALLRDGDEDIPVDAFRILLGQNIGVGAKEVRIGGGPRTVRDGYMRKKEHLNLQLNEIHGGVLGPSPGSLMIKEQKRRKAIMQLRNKDVRKESLSRGFARNIEDADSQDGNPHRHEHLVSLWIDEGKSVKDRFGDMELNETDEFSSDVQHCLKQLAQWKKKFDREHKVERSAETESLQKVNPATIPAPPHMRLPVHMAIRRNHRKKKNHKSTHGVSTRIMRPPNQNEVLRVLIHAFPSSLIIRDSQDQTPLMTCLNLIHYSSVHPIDMDTIEILLGMQTAGYKPAPQWLEDINFFQQHQNYVLGYSSPAERFSAWTSNAAMISCDGKLPLHVAAREGLPTSIVHAILTFYPGAKHAKDDCDSTPLHCALQNMTSETSLDIDMICMLLDEKVLRIKNVLNQNIFDLLVANSKDGNLPRTLGAIDNPRTIRKITSFQLVFHHTVVDDVLNPQLRKLSIKDFFLYLYALPVWLRKEACATPAVQSLLKQELSTATNTALILFNGISLLSLAIAFTSLVDSSISNQMQSDNVDVLNRQKIGVLAANTYLSCFGLCSTYMSTRLNGTVETFSNPWIWITAIALLSTFVVTVRINTREDYGAIHLENDQLFIWNIISVSMVWMAVLGYLARWWYGISKFCCIVMKMMKSLISPLIVLFVLILASMQVIYIIHARDTTNGRCVYEGESEREESLQICTIWDSYKIIYLLLMGENFFGTEVSSSNATIIILLALIILAFILILHTIHISILNLERSDLVHKMVGKYWSPMLTHVLMVQRFADLLGCTGKNLSPLSRSDELFEFILSSYTDSNLIDTKWWYLEEDVGKSCFVRSKWTVRIIGIFVIPIWAVIGAATLGILWPRQIREMIFQTGPIISYQISGNDAELPFDNSSQTGILQSDIMKMKKMLHDRFQTVEEELYGLRSEIKKTNMGIT